MVLVEYDPNFHVPADTDYDYGLHGHGGDVDDEVKTVSTIFHSSALLNLKALIKSFNCLLNF